MNPKRIRELREVYRRGLLEDTLPFWIEHSVDREHGGFRLSLDRDGSVLCPDKGLWGQARFTWLLATLYESVEPRAEWLELARHGIEFIRAHGFDQDGRMFFSVTREGRPLRKRRYLFTECFAVMALAAWGKASGEARALEEALALYERILRLHTTPGMLEPKVDPGGRPSKGLGMPMVLIHVAQILRRCAGEGEWSRVADRCIEEIERDHLDPASGVLLESVGPRGERIDTFEGRTINPGHSIEAGWFILEEARQRGADRRLLELGLRIVEGAWQIGWDREHGGLLYFRDARGLPCTEYWHDMKFWWPHNEAIIATLLAHLLTGEARYEEWHREVHDWAFAHFPDPEHGEWFGYLHRDGGLSTRVKGNLWKGPYHLPRMQLVCWRLLEEMEAAAGAGPDLSTTPS